MPFTPLASRSKMKSLGTIVEYLLKNIDLNRFHVQVGAINNQISIQVWPNVPDGYGYWYKVDWNYGFHSKLYINPNVLRNGAEW